MSKFLNIQNHLIAGEINELILDVKEALSKGVNADEILNTGLIGTMDIVGEKMQSGEMFIPEVLMAAHGMKAAVEILKPKLSCDKIGSAGKLVIGTVKGDLHDIGKNLVMLMMESAGFQVIDLGVDVPAETFLKAVEENDADILALSALLTTTMPMMQKTVELVKEKGLNKKAKIIVGGAPVSQGFADKIGADGFAPDAGAASKLARSLVAAEQTGC